MRSPCNESETYHLKLSTDPILGPILMDLHKKIVVGVESDYIFLKPFFQAKYVFLYGTNNYVELNSLKLLLIFAVENHCNLIEIFGDSKLSSIGSTHYLNFMCTHSDDYWTKLQL